MKDLLFLGERGSFLGWESCQQRGWQKQCNNDGYSERSLLSEVKLVHKNLNVCIRCDRIPLCNLDVAKHCKAEKIAPGPKAYEQDNNPLKAYIKRSTDKFLFSACTLL